MRILYRLAYEKRHKNCETEEVQVKEINYASEMFVHSLNITSSLLPVICPRYHEQ